MVLLRLKLVIHTSMHNQLGLTSALHTFTLCGFNTIASGIM